MARSRPGTLFQRVKGWEYTTDRNVGSKGEHELPASAVEVANPLHEES